MSSVTLKNIAKVYPNGVQAVYDFNLEIADKEFIILVGPSGCGKSTTLRMIAGLEDISEGELYIDDNLVNEVPAKERDIAMVFQNYALYPHMTVYENMSFGMRIRHIPRDEIRQKVEEAARILEISELLDRKPLALSGGERQRVALGRAMVRDPKVFLLDEPLSNLDAKLRTAMRAELSKLHQRLETTFVYVTHDQTEAMTMATRIVVMRDGYVQQIAAPQELFNSPDNLFVATFIGTPQMNTVPVRISFEGDDVYIVFERRESVKPVITESVAEVDTVDADDTGDAEEDVGDAAGESGDALEQESPSPDVKPSELSRLKLPPKFMELPVLREYDGKQLIFGIRPSDIYVNEDMRRLHPEWIVDGEVELIEHLGAEQHLYFLIGGEEFTAVVDARDKAEIGGSLAVVLDLNAGHLFDPDTEIAIGHSIAEPSPEAAVDESL